jgi:hypothetical protein
MSEKLFSGKEEVFMRGLNAPRKVQDFIDSLEYNAGKRVSVLDVLRNKKADCLEAACFACFVLKRNGINAFLVDLCAVRDEDHVICVFKSNGLYGAIAQSKFLGLRYRHPVYKSVRELVMSYFNSYFSFQGFFGLRSYSIMKLKFSNEMIMSAMEILKIENKFADIKHEDLFSKKISLTPATIDQFKREIIILPGYAKVPKKYKK